LVSRSAQVKDGEPAIAQHSGSGHNDSFVVRPATFQAREHGLNDSGIFPLTAITVDACDSTHISAYVEPLRSFLLLRASALINLMAYFI
jgi:hypothetical protein